ncbi:uncharacterized protein BT62DRAFT_31080 [Guyanagaster necrorhizus]|uniref:Uncharacterized protein n=1 Tax=Guyanagaster necrorhizus TaxID=856835 RepID=A0A9P8AYP2_9AGAR|nr:uncharacterized protein BT62DRAFT_31080 [Guyanagaster necrorhizus MCA 3950]KAG7452853.1 hypothetical protein BT62DRAFT_31080 [Guyanagaster necrorhizus MCA 3950]
MGLFSFFQSNNENTNKENEQKDALQTLKSFIETRPSSQYTFDSERDSPRSTICRPSDSTDGSKECITIEMNSKKLFATMQSLGFFCALPVDPTQTYMECTPMHKS